jgi:hypothetical protein
VRWSVFLAFILLFVWPIHHQQKGIQFCDLFILQVATILWWLIKNDFDTSRIFIEGWSPASLTRATGIDTMREDGHGGTLDTFWPWWTVQRLVTTNLGGEFRRRAEVVPTLARVFNGCGQGLKYRFEVKTGAHRFHRKSQNLVILIKNRSKFKFQTCRRWKPVLTDKPIDITNKLVDITGLSVPKLINRLPVHTY